MIINHNIAAMNTHRQLGANNTNASKNLEKLSSGLKINKAGDDAAGLAISEKMRGQIRGLDMAQKNAQDGISLIQTAEGALNETHDILQRMRELAVQSSNDTNTDTDRAELQKEVDQLAQEITRIANDTEFNNKSLLNGSVSDENISSATFHIGANQGQNINLSIGAMDAKSLGVSRDVNVGTATGAGDVSSAGVSSTFGPQVKDGEVITLSYTAGSAATAATNAVKTGDNDLGASVGFDTATKIVIDGQDVALTSVKALGATYDAATNKADVQTALQADIDTALGAGKYNVGINGDKLTLTDIQTTGEASEVDLTGSDVGTGATLLGFTTLDAVNGEDANAEVSAKVTMTGASGTIQSINVKADDTKFTVASGDYKGISVNLSGPASGITGGDDTITIDMTPTAATSASFSGNAKVADAKTAAGVDISNKNTANTAITTIQSAIDTVSAERSKLGAVQNRLEHTINNLGTSSENLTAAESRIRDVDYVLSAA
ncbi:flagellin [Sporosarcina koreensis]|uniref:flagellin N-terminal helical domain-containing protein n=1 Tax=Sporosarcina koreensis TaxID=334735 RepID=UPI00058FBCF5|nr:flagellin [Sporosarcina koreensis]